jgi:hypothetical protein
MTSQLDQIEDRLQKMIESSSILFQGRNLISLLPGKLVRAMQGNLLTASNAEMIAPDIYTIHAAPAVIEDWSDHSDVLADFVKVLQETAREVNVQFRATPQIQLVADEALKPEELQVYTNFQQDHSGETAVLLAASETEESSDKDAKSMNAFLIVNGTETVPLHKTVLNIGRRQDNDIVIEDARVSRSHAQLRKVRDSYILFDLNSSGGTFVNGLRINQQTLKAGDVISMAGVVLIYGEDRAAPNQEALGKTSPSETLGKKSDHK